VLATSKTCQCSSYCEKICQLWLTWRMRNISTFKLKSNLHIVQGHKCIEMLDQRAMTCIHINMHTHTHTHTQFQGDKQPLTMNESVVWSFAPVVCLSSLLLLGIWTLHATESSLFYISFPFACQEFNRSEVTITVLYILIWKSLCSTETDHKTDRLRCLPGCLPDICFHVAHIYFL